MITQTTVPEGLKSKGIMSSWSIEPKNFQGILGKKPITHLKCDYKKFSGILTWALLVIIFELSDDFYMSFNFFVSLCWIIRRFQTDINHTSSQQCAAFINRNQACMKRREKYLHHWLILVPPCWMFSKFGLPKTIWRKVAEKSWSKSLHKWNRLLAGSFL